MSSQNRPASNKDAPDPATSYERAKPEKEAGMGRLDNNTGATPTSRPSEPEKSVSNAHTSRQLNSHDVVNQRGAATPGQQKSTKPAEQPDHSMKDEEPMGSDQAPTGATPDKNKRHPKTDGKGGTP